MGLLSLIYLILKGRSADRRQTVAETAREIMAGKISGKPFAPAHLQAELVPARSRRSKKDRKI